MSPAAKARAVSILTKLAELEGLDDVRRTQTLELVDAVQFAQPEEIRARYCSFEWWGGSGSMADFIPTTPNSRTRYIELLVQLVRVFDRAGIDCPGAMGWARVFEKWMRKGTVQGSAGSE